MSCDHYCITTNTTKNQASMKYEYKIIVHQIIFWTKVNMQIPDDSEHLVFSAACYIEKYIKNSAVQNIMSQLFQKLFI